MIQDAYPLAALQAGMLYHSQLSEQAATFHDVLGLTVRGRFDAAALDAALGEVVARHPVLRTSFDLTGFSESVQLVHDSAATAVAVTDWTALGADEAGQRLAQWRAEEQFRGYDLSRPPLLRVAVHLLPGGLFGLSMSFHHAILDGWSAASLITELLRRYAARQAGRSLPSPVMTDTVADFVAAERAAVADAQTREYWGRIVQDSNAGRLPRLPGYPAERARVSGRVSADLPEDVAAALTRLAEAMQVPLRSVLLAVHLRMMGLFTGDADVLTGVVTHGRPETESGAEVLGLFLNVVPIRLRVDASTWAELVVRVHEAHVGLLPHRRFPLFEIQQLAGRSPLFDTAFDYRDFHVYDALAGDDDLEIVARNSLETTDIPFSAAFARNREHGGLMMMLSFDEAEFAAEQVERWKEAYLAALAAVAADPAADPRPSADLIRADVAAIGSWNDTDRPVAYPLTLHGLVGAAAGRTPHALAVIGAEGELTYERMWRRVAAIADRLRAAGVGTEDVVALGLPRSIDAVVGLIGIQQAGAAALPLDLDHPDRRLAALMDSAGARVVLTRGDVSGRFAEMSIVDITSAGESDGPLPPVREVSPEALAMVLFTSGSTGKPKGVLMSHRCAVEYCAGQARRMGMNAQSRMAQRSPLSVDAAAAELVMAFAVGGAAAIVPTEAVADPESFAATFERFGITSTILVPSIIAPHVEAETFTRCGSLRQVASVGEALPRAMAAAYAKQTSAGLFNLYGPTEGGIGATSEPVDPHDTGTTVPIGGPVDNVRLHLLDAYGFPVPVGTPGELFISGAQVARGYLGQPELTAERFVPDHLSGVPGRRMYRTGDVARWLPDGRIDFLGRVDNQIKIRGVRTEPGEIEAVLLGHDEISQAVVTVLQQAGDRKTLVAYVVTEGEGEGLAERLRTFLDERLPRALIPSAFVVVDAIPTLPNGKVDRAALPEPDLTGAADYLAPRDLVEGRLTVIWEEVLGVPEVGVRDDFFALGGHSLTALRLTMRVRREFERELPVETVLANPTVERLAMLLRSEETLAPSVPIVALRSTGSKIPIFFMHGLGGQVFRYHKLSMHLGDGRPAFGIPARGFHADEVPHSTVDSMADDYSQRILDMRPRGPYYVGGFCVGGNISLEVARRLKAAGQEVPLVIAFWSHADNPISDDLYDDTKLMMYALAGGLFSVDEERLDRLSPDEKLVAIIEGASRAGGLNPAVTDVEQAKRIMRVYRANAVALGGYQHAPYEGDMVLLKPVGDTDFPLEDEFGWRAVVRGDLRLIPIPGTRDNIADEPQATQAAAILRELMDDD
jgi:amino acid adenylation domain-containing protein